MIIFLYKNLYEEIDIFNLILIFLANILVINSIFALYMKNPVYSLLFLILNYSLTGLLFIYSGFAFLGLIFALIYVGAISVLLLFTLMLLNLKVLYYETSFLIKPIYFIFFTLFIEFTFLFLFKNSNNFIDLLYINWFETFLIKGDYIDNSFEVIVSNSETLLIIGFLLLIILVASVSLATAFKTSKKQNKYSQLKNYNKSLYQ